MKAFLITIDTEGDNLWKWDRKTPISTENSAYLRRFQRVCNAYEFKPTYLVNYEMAMDDYFVEWVAPEIESNHCEIGMHLHAWNSPPEYILPQEENGLPFDVKLNDNKISELASMFSSLGGKAKVSKDREAIINLFAQGKIDYETACFAIKRSFK